VLSEWFNASDALACQSLRHTQ
jgi:hypothetical protein